MAPYICGIDFGTSNSAVALDAGSQVDLLKLGATAAHIPTAVFVPAHGAYLFGEAALQAAADEEEGRLFRSIKSLLPSDLYDEVAAVDGGNGVAFGSLITQYLADLRRRAQVGAKQPVKQAVLGRPVRFSEQPDQDARAETRLRAAAKLAGFESVHMLFEPIAAALDYERDLNTEQIALVADLGGGTSDFSAIRLGPKRHRALDRSSDALASSGVYVAGTDVDRQIDLRAIMPLLGMGGVSAEGGLIPSKIYFELATWHLLNFAYKPSRVREIKSWDRLYQDQAAHARLVRVLEQRIAHHLLAAAERAKIELSEHAVARVLLDPLENGLTLDYPRDAFAQDINAIVDAIEACARECVLASGVKPERFDVVIFTGGTSSIQLVAQAIQRIVPNAKAIVHDRFGGVARGLAYYGRLLREDATHDAARA